MLSFIVLLLIISFITCCFNSHFYIFAVSEPKKCSKKETSIGVMLMSLTKEYTGNRKLAVKDLSLTFYKDQITALLGPNGAGKTTVMYVRC